MSQALMLAYFSACFLNIDLILRTLCMSMMYFIPSAINNYSDFWSKVSSAFMLILPNYFNLCEKVFSFMSGLS